MAQFTTSYSLYSVVISQAVPSTPATQSRNYNLGWNSSAIGVVPIYGSGGIEVSTPASIIGVVVGLAQNFVGPGYETIDFGIYISKGNAIVVEGGVTKTASFLTNGDPVTITRTHNTIKYFVGGALVYTSLVEPTQMLLTPATSMYSGGDSLVGLTYISMGATDDELNQFSPLVGIGNNTVHVVASEIASSINSLQPLTVSGGSRRLRNYLQPLVTHSNDLGGNYGYATIQPLITAGAGVVSNFGYSVNYFQSLVTGRSSVGSNNLPILQTGGGDRPIGSAINYLERLTITTTSGALAPEFGLSICSTEFFTTSAHSITGEVGTSDTVLQPLQTISADHAYGYSSNYMNGGFELFGGEAIPIDGYAFLTLTNTFRITSTGTEQAQNAADITCPAYSLNAYCGGYADLSLPQYTLTITGVVDGVLYGDMVLPTPSLIANGITGGTSAAMMTMYGAYVTTGYSGGVGVLPLASGYSVNASGQTGAVGEASLTLTSRYGLVAEATQGNFGVAVMGMPSLVSAPSGQAWLVQPTFTMYAMASAVVAVTYEAYAINLSTGAVTHYTNYPFDNIIRLGAHYYGINSEGMFQIGGDKDITTSIPAHFKTFMTNFGTTVQKRVPSVYTSGRSDGGVTLGITADEGDLYEYTSSWNNVAEAKNHRTIVGKNIRGSYYSFEISNVDGGTLELDEITANIAVSERTL